MQLREPATDLLAHDAEERRGLRLDDGDRAARVARCCGDLEADPPGADDDDPRPVGEAGLERLRLLHLAEVEHAVEIRTRHVEGARRGAGRDEEALVGELVAVGKGQGMLLGVERRGRVAEAQLDALLGVPVAVVRERRVHLVLALEHGLRQRRSLVGQPVLLRHEDDRTVGVALADALDRLRRGEPATDDDVCRAPLLSGRVSGHDHTLTRESVPVETRRLPHSSERPAPLE